MRFRFSFLVALSAALVAGCAAYYSVFGLSQLFAGASLAVIIMASSLEFAKIVSVSFLQRYWNRISTALKTYLAIGVFILVCITSAGIYGFLSNAYQKTAHQLELIDGELSVINNKKSLFDKGILDNQNIISIKTTRLSQLNNLRTTQETRLDATTSTAEKNRIRNDINLATREIQKLNTEIDTLNIRNIALTDSSNFYANKSIESKSKNNVAGEIGPLKYLSELTGKPMDKIVNWFILLLIFVFDPLAVALVIATNRMLKIEDDDDDDEKEKKKSPLLRPLTDLIKKKEQSEIVLDTPNDINNEEIMVNDITPEPINEGVEVIDEPEYLVEVEPEPVNEGVEIIDEQPHEQELTYKKEPVIPTGHIKLEDIKEIKEQSNRGFSMNIPKPSSNTIQRIGTNKFLRNNDEDRIFFKKKN